MAIELECLNAYGNIQAKLQYWTVEKNCNIKKWVARQNESYVYEILAN